MNEMPIEPAPAWNTMNTLRFPTFHPRRALRALAGALAGLAAAFLACGAEPVNPDTLARFAARLAASGLRPDALAPVYGLAEATVG